jgi:hypothetical protein
MLDAVVRQLTKLSLILSNTPNLVPGGIYETNFDSHRFFAGPLDFHRDSDRFTGGFPWS